MNNPLISDYIDTIKSAEDNFEELSCLRPVWDDEGLPVMTSGNFAVVFKMRNVQNGRFFAENVCHDDTILYGNKTNCE